MEKYRGFLFHNFSVVIPEVAPVEASRITVGFPFPTSVEQNFLFTFFLLEGGGCGWVGVEILNDK